MLLRHDVDMSLAAAVTMAELEAERDVRATYFLMTRSDFYNLDGAAGVAALARLRELGHRVGLHGVYPDATLDDRFDPVVAWHTPDPDYMSARIPGVVERHAGAGFFDPDALPLRLEPALAERLPARGARGRELRLAAAARPPRDLGVRGSDDARDDGRRSSTPSASCAGSSSPRIESILSADGSCTAR